MSCKSRKTSVTARVYRELAFGLKISAFPRKNRKQDRELASFPNRFLVGGHCGAIRERKADAALASVMTGPRALLLDEPTAGSIRSPGSSLPCSEGSTRVGITILLVEQRLDSVLKLADKLLVMTGEIIVQGAFVLPGGKSEESRFRASRRFPRLGKGPSAHGAEAQSS